MTESTEKMRSGRSVAESEYEEVRLEVGAAAALHLNGDAIAGSTESEHAASGLVVEAAEAAAALDLDEDANTAAAKNAMSESQENKHEKTNEGDENIRRLVEERRNTAKVENTN